jgi:hypothetical protein
MLCKGLTQVCDRVNSHIGVGGFPPFRQENKPQVLFGRLRAGFRLAALAQDERKDGARNWCRNGRSGTWCSESEVRSISSGLTGLW